MIPKPKYSVGDEVYYVFGHLHEVYSLKVTTIYITIFKNTTRIKYKCKDFWRKIPEDRLFSDIKEAQKYTDLLRDLKTSS